MPPHERSGPLWDQFRKFERAGLSVDAKSYATAFRVGDKPGSDTVPSLVSDLPEGEPPICCGCELVWWPASDCSRSSYWVVAVAASLASDEDRRASASASPNLLMISNRDPENIPE